MTLAAVRVMATCRSPFLGGPGRACPFCRSNVAAVLARKCSKCCQLFRAFRGLAFLRGMVQPYFSVGSLGSLRGYKVEIDSMGKLIWNFIWNFMVHPLLGEEDSVLSPRWL